MSFLFSTSPSSPSSKDLYRRLSSGFQRKRTLLLGLGMKLEVPFVLAVFGVGSGQQTALYDGSAGIRHSRAEYVKQHATMVGKYWAGKATSQFDQTRTASRKTPVLGVNVMVADFNGDGRSDWIDLVGCVHVHGIPIDTFEHSLFSSPDPGRGLHFGVG